MTHDTDAALRRGYDALLAARERATRERSDAPPAAVPLERMLALVEGRGSERERLETLDAVMADAASAREFELLRALAAGRAPAPPATLPRRWAMWVLPSSLAAAAALTLVALPALRRPTVGGPEVVRGAVQGAVLLAPPLEASAAESRTFRWHAVPGAQRYAVEILTAGGTPVFTTRVADTTVTLPADVHLAPGVEHRWWVATELADGTQRRSAFRRLLVRESR